MARKHLMTSVLVVLASLAIALAQEEEDGKYTTKYDDINVDEILANPKLRNQYVDCYMEVGPCLTADAKYLKEKFAEAFTTKCKKCTAKQVELFDKVSAWYVENEPETWNRLINKAIQEAQSGASKN